jgi:transcriptional regulator GlxA family with amidase domain
MVRRTVGIFVFDDVEVLDFAGPFEVFSRTRLTPGAAARRSIDSAPFDVFTVAKSPDVVCATGGLRICPSYGWLEAPRIDILVIPGGFGTRPLLTDEATRHWIGRAAAGAACVTSVCTGALLLAEAGVLRDCRATTHWAALDLLESIDSTIQVERNARVVRDRVVTSAGVSAGIDMAFALVDELCGTEVANDTARYIDYRR